MSTTYSDEEIHAAKQVIADINNAQITQGIANLRKLKDDTYAAIPDKKRISRGITWVLRRISRMLIELCANDEQLKSLGQTLYANLDKSDRLIGIAIYLTAEYGIKHPQEVFDFFLEIADSDNWEVREFAADGFQWLTKPNKDVVFPWLKEVAKSDKPNVRRFVSETLRPVTKNRWLQQEPRYSLEVLRILFKEANAYPRTSVGNNLSDLSRRNPELILEIVQELVEMADKNSYWIAHRACRNLVKQYPTRVMDILGVDEYHYKDRHFYRAK